MNPIGTDACKYRKREVIYIELAPVISSIYSIGIIKYLQLS